MRSTSGDDVINGVHHIAIRTHHLDRLLHFYCETLDFQLAAVLGGYDACDATGAPQRAVVLACGNIYVQLIEVPATAADAGGGPAPSGPTGIGPICLDVADLDATLALLRTAGLRAERSPGTSSDGAPNIQVCDPDGNIIELQDHGWDDHPLSLARLATLPPKS